MKKDIPIPLIFAHGFAVGTLVVMKERFKKRAKRGERAAEEALAREFLRYVKNWYKKPSTNPLSGIAKTACGYIALLEGYFAARPRTRKDGYGKIIQRAIALHNEKLTNEVFGTLARVFSKL